MTLPDERYRAVLYTKQFLQDLLITPRIPKEVKDRARSCLRHYPDTWDMQQAAEASPHVFAERIEEVTRLFKKYEEGKQNEA